MNIFYSFIILVSLTFIGCGSNGAPVTTVDTESNNTVVDNNTEPTPTPSNPKDLSWFENNLGTYMSKSTTYSVSPNSNSCIAGDISLESQNDFLLLVNKIRDLHNLKPLTLSSRTADMQEAALMMTANNKLDHHPSSDWTCYTASGDAGAGASNLGLGYSTLGTATVVGWLQDRGVASLGHRRWIIAPSMTETSFGHVGRGYSMHTIGYSGSDTVPFIAYPFEEYPTDLVGNARWSFSVNDGSVYSTSVNFSNATVHISGIGNVSFDSLGGNYGSGGTIAWDSPSAIQPNVEYTVIISGITGAPESSYTYTVTIVE